MSEKPYVFGVDDEMTNRAILQEIFEDEVELLCVENGQACLDAVGVRKPDVILLDVNMPGMDGLEVCKQLRTNPDNQDIPIIFVSALASAAERLAGYEAGGDDYITKPFEPAELKAKVEMTVKQHNANKELQHSSSYAMQTAMTAMSNASELGLVVRFLQDTFGCKTPMELGKHAFECIAQYGVEATIVMRQGKDYISLFSDNIERPLEISVVEQLQQKGRIFTHGNKVVINGKRATLLIRNIPLDDEDKIGRLRDHLAVLLDGIDARLKGIEIENELIEKQMELTRAIELTQNEIVAIDEIHRKQQIGVVAELANIARRIEGSFMSLGLTDEQEDNIMGVISEAENNTEILYSKGVELDSRFDNIVKQLRTVL